MVRVNDCVWVCVDVRMLVCVTNNSVCVSVCMHVSVWWVWECGEYVSVWVCVWCVSGHVGAGECVYVCVWYVWVHVCMHCVCKCVYVRACGGCVSVWVDLWEWGGVPACIGDCVYVWVHYARVCGSLENAWEELGGKREWGRGETLGCAWKN